MIWNCVWQHFIAGGEATDGHVNKMQDRTCIPLTVLQCYPPNRPGTTLKTVQSVKLGGR
jgi:hypothetical protein